MLSDLAGMPLTVLMVLYFADRLPMSETAISSIVACDRKTARKNLETLAEKDLVFRLRRYGGWDLTRPAIQLKLQFVIGGNGTGNISPSSGNISPSLGKVSPSLGKVSPSSGKVSPSEALYNIDLDRSIDREREDTFSPLHNEISLKFLKRLGITGDLLAMAWANPEETLAAWWASQWGNNPRALLAKHLLDKRPIDETYSSLAAWRMRANPEAIEELLVLVRFANTSNGRSWLPDRDEYPRGIDLSMFNAAVKIYVKLGGLPLG